MSETFKALMVAHAGVIEDLMAHEGELTESHEAILAAMMRKVDNLEAFRSGLDAEAERFDRMIKEFQAVKKRITDRKEWVDRYVISTLQMSGQAEIAGDMIKFVLQNNPPSVVIDDEAQIPNGYMRMPEPVPPKAAPDRKAIGEQLKAGKEVPGARLVRGVRLVVKPNSMLIKAKAVSE